MRKIGDIIRYTRKKQGLTLEALSKKTGFSLHYLSKVERGDRGGRIQTYSRIANALGLQIEDLLEKNSRNPYKLSLGQKIVNLRKSKKMKQVELASLAKISRFHMCLIEKDKRGVSVETLSHLASALGVRMDELPKPGELNSNFSTIEGVGIRIRMIRKSRG